METSDNFELWQFFKSGNMDAFKNIYDQNFQRLFDYGMRLCGDRELVKDAIHDLFVKLWNNRENLGDVIAIRSYLLVSLRGCIYNKISREKKIIASEISDNLSFDIVFSVENELIRKESDLLKVQKLIEGLNHLSDKQKEIIYLKYYQELSYEAVADIMNISIKATYKLNARALEALRAVIGAAFIAPVFIGMLFNISAFRAVH